MHLHHFAFGLLHESMMNLSILALIITLVPEVISSRSEALSKRVSNSDHETVGMFGINFFESTFHK